MSQFHTDEYVDFLHRITPDNAHMFAKEQVKCQPLCVTVVVPLANTLLQTTWEMIVRYLTGCSSIAQYQLAAPWVCPSRMIIWNLTNALKRGSSKIVER